MAQIHVGDLSRIRHILGILGRHGLGRMLVEAGLGRYMPEQPQESQGGEGHWTVRVRKALVELGPTYVKLGQVLSVRPDIVPARLADELTMLLDRVPPVGFQAIRETLEEDLGGHLEQTFSAFDEVAMASASIAQVHRATLLDGTAVAVKVRRPDIEKVIRADLRILYTMARLVEGKVDLPGLHTPVTIVTEFEAALLQELDFVREARNAERFRAVMESSLPDVKVPTVFPTFSSLRVLVLELVEGRSAGSLKASHPEAAPFARKLLEATYVQVFEKGLFHGDPHPGNLVVLPGGGLAYLDFGLVGTITAEMQEVLASMFMALVFQDSDALVMSILRAGASRERVDVRSLKGEVEALMARFHGASLAEVTEQANLLEFMEVVTRHKLTLPREYAVLLRTASLVFGMMTRLLPDVDMVAEARPLAERLVARRAAPGHLAADASRMFLHLRTGMATMPLQVTQLLTDLEAGRLQVAIKDREADLMRREVRDAAIRVSLALCSVALAIAGAVMAATAPWRIGDLPVVAILGFLTLIASTVIWTYLVAHTHLAHHVRLKRLASTVGSFIRFLRGDGRKSAP